MDEGAPRAAQTALRRLWRSNPGLLNPGQYEAVHNRIVGRVDLVVTDNHSRLIDGAGGRGAGNGVGARVFQRDGRAVRPSQVAPAQTPRAAIPADDGTSLVDLGHAGARCGPDGERRDGPVGVPYEPGEHVSAAVIVTGHLSGVIDAHRRICFAGRSEEHTS